GDSRCRVAIPAPLETKRFLRRRLLSAPPPDVPDLTGDDALASDKKGTILGHVARDAPQRGSSLTRDLDLAAEKSGAAPPLREHRASGRVDRKTVELRREDREERKPIDHRAGDRERCRGRAQWCRKVRRPLMDVHADTEHQRATLPIRGRVRENARDLLVAELDVVGPF